MAHVTNLVVLVQPRSTRRNSSATVLRLCAHSKMITYCSKYTLFTPRNGRRKFRSPVQVPSSVLQWTSRTPSPSSSRANSPRLWLTVAWPRPRRPSGLYPFQSSVYTIAPGTVAGRTVASTNSADPLRWPTLSQSRPLSRPVTPGTGGRSVSQVPWPLAWFARRRGGSSGSVCGTPFFPRILVGLVGLQDLVIQGHPVAVPEGQVLQPVSQVQQPRAVALQLTGELRGGDPLGDPADDQDQFDGPPLDSVEGRAGEGIEHPLAMAAAVVQDRGASAAVDGHAVALMAPRAGEPVGVQPRDQLDVTGALVHQVGDREVHGRLQCRSAGLFSSEYLSQKAPQ